MSSPRSEHGEQAKRLVSWKEIAAFLDRAERTVKRWERERGLPVHRISWQGAWECLCVSA